MKALWGAVAVVLIAVLGYFFSLQLQILFGEVVTRIRTKMGKVSKSSEYRIQRYVFLHRASSIAKLYNWVNVQLIATGLKRAGVTPVGYLIYWAVVACILSVVLTVVASFNVLGIGFLAVLLMILCLVMTRVVVADKMERREADVMDAVDLIIPEISKGTKNAITMYIDNFAPALQPDFRAFLSNIQDRGYAFEDAMFILADSLGAVFRDFAQKAVFFERLGEPDMADIFTDILETNRNRRQLRYENNIKFSENRMSFIVSVCMTFGYFLFIVSTDEFSRNFFLRETAGHILLIVIISVVIGVLSYLTTIKSKNL